MPERPSLNDAWRCEAIRLREVQWGALDDRAACLRAQGEPGALSQITVRADVLAEASGLNQVLQRFASSMMFALILLLSAALIGGAGSALAALGDGLRPVNVISALMLLLGLNLLSLCAWFISMLGWSAPGGMLAQFWQWLAGKLSRGPDIALAGQAWWSIWRQAGALRWLLSGMTHGLWVAANIAMLAVMVFNLSTRSFSFAWETTLLSADVFVAITHALGALPQWLGFAIPDAETVRASGRMPSTAADAQVLWAGWLLGVLTVYGLAPRLLLLTWSVVRVVYARSLTQPDLNTPYYLALLVRMQGLACLPEGLPPEHVVWRPMRSPDGAPGVTKAMLTGIELDASAQWPVHGLGTEIFCAPVMDSRESRRVVLATAAQRRPEHLAIACDARHTPDLGTMRLIAELSSFAGHTLIWLLNVNDDASHINAWRSQAHSLTGVELLESDAFEPVSSWLGHSHD